MSVPMVDMKMKFGVSVALAFFCIPLTAISDESRVADTTYRLREGDALFVSVWKEESLQKELRVLPDGSVTFPLAGRIPVSGATVTDVEERLGAKLEKFIASPVVTVTVTAIEGNRVFVLGKVSHPGPVTMNAPMTALQAISIAGGLTEFAGGNDIKVLRHDKDSDKLLPVRYDDLLRGKSLQTDVRLSAGDTILVP